MIRERDTDDQDVEEEIKQRAEVARPQTSELDPIAVLVRQSHRSDVVKFDKCSFSAKDCERATALMTDGEKRFKLLRLQIGVGPRGMSMFLDVFRTCTMTLQHLDLSRNRLQGEFCTALSSALEPCECLAFLDLSYNPIEDIGFNAVAAFAARHESLVCLHVKHCRLSSTSGIRAGELIKAVATRKFVLGVQQNMIGSQGLEAIRVALIGSTVSVSATRQRIAVQ